MVSFKGNEGALRQRIADLEAKVAALQIAEERTAIAMLASNEQKRRIMVSALATPAFHEASNSDKLLCLLESFSQRGVPLAGIDSPHSHPQGFLASHQDDQFLASRDRGVQQVSLEHEIVLRVQGNHDARKLGTLTFVN